MNKKLRPNFSEENFVRYDSFEILDTNPLELRDDDKDLEWLSWNWRTTEI